MAKFEPPENEEERGAWIKRQKAKGVRAFKGRSGWAASAAPLPKNPQTAEQQDHRRNLPAVTRRWSTLTLNQCAAWRSLAANTYFITETGKRVRRNCYQLFVKLNVRRADLGLPQFSDPPAKAVFSTRPVFELAVSCVAGRPAIHLRVQGSTELRVFQHTDGWIDVPQVLRARVLPPPA